MREAVEEVAKAVDLDPLSPQINADLAFAYLMAGRYSEGVDQCHRALELDPSYVRAYLGLALGYGSLSRWHDGIEMVEQGLRVAPQSPWFLGLLGWLVGCAGDVDRAKECGKQLKAMSERTYVSPMWFSFLHTGLDDRDGFFKAMNAACDDRAPWIRYMNRGSFFWRFASDERFQQLLKRLRLDDS